MTAEIVVTVRANWLTWVLLRWAARAIVVIDDAETVVPWAQARTFAVEPGEHAVSAGVRYRGFNQLLGQDPVRVTVTAGQRVELIARNGLMNNEPFYIKPVAW